MTTTTQPTTLEPEFVERLLDLPRDQREDLGLLLLDSIDESMPTDDAWVEKIRRRIESYLADPSQARPYDDSLQRVRQRLADYVAQRNRNRK